MYLIFHNIFLLQLCLHVFIMDFICFKYYFNFSNRSISWILRFVARVFISKAGKAVKFVFQQLSLSLLGYVVRRLVIQPSTK